MPPRHREGEEKQKKWAAENVKEKKILLSSESSPSEAFSLPEIAFPATQNEMEYFAGRCQRSFFFFVF